MPYGEGNNIQDADDLGWDEDEVRRQWRKLAKRLNTFKQQFAEEYLAYLRTRHQIQHREGPVQEIPIDVGDLVLIVNKNEKRHLWEMAEIIEISPSSDGKCRAVRLRTKNGECDRDITKLCPLLKYNELRPVQEDPGQNPSSEASEGGTVEQQGDEDPPEVTVPVPVPVQTPTVGPTQSEATSSRPSRAAKTAGRKKVQQWTQGLTDK